MNALDWAIIALITIGAMTGISQGALRMVTSVVSLGAGIYFASLYYRAAAEFAEKQLGSSPTVSSVVGYLALFAAVFFVIQVIGNAVVRLLHIVHLGWLDRLVGSALGASLAAIAIGLAVMLLTTVLPADEEIVRRSELAPRLLVYNEALVQYVPEPVKEVYEGRRAELARYWADSEAKLARQVASPGATASVGVSR